MRSPQNSHESMPVWHRGRGENYRPTNERAIASTRPRPSSLASFYSPPPPVSITRAFSCPPHWWRAADIVRAYLLKGLPWRLAAVARQSWSQKEREEGETVVHLLQREQEERFKKEKRRAQTWASLLLSCERLPASTLRRDLYHFLSPGLCLGG